MHPKSRFGSGGWLIVALAIILPVVTYVVANYYVVSHRSALVAITWLFLLWSAYLILAFVMRSNVVLCMLLGMCLSGPFWPSVGRAEETLIRTYGVIGLGGLVGCLFGEIYDSRQSRPRMSRNGEPKNRIARSEALRQEISLDKNPNPAD